MTEPTPAASPAAATPAATPAPPSTAPAPPPATLTTPALRPGAAATPAHARSIRPPRVRTRLWLAAALPALLVATALWLVFVERYTADLTEAWRERARGAALQLAGAAEFPLFARDTEGLKRLAEAARHGDSQLRAVSIFDPAGRLAAASGSALGAALPIDGNEHIRLDRQITVLVPIRPSQALAVDLFTETTRSAPVPSTASTPTQGYVLVQLDLEQLNLRRTELLSWTLLATTLAALLAAVLSSLIASRVTRPIAHINRVVQRIGAGELEARTVPERCAALADLAGGINEMAEKVALTQTELRQQVDQATAELRRQRDVAEQAARLDALTQVLGRRGFTEIAEREIHRCMRHPHPLSLIMIDIDHFKVINDTHGHATGDSVLLHFAQLLARELRENDVVGRIGGEEFAVLLPDSALDQARRVAERMRLSVEQTPLNVRGQPLPFSASFGVAQFDTQELTLDSLLARADAALYQAKHLGRNRVEVATPPGVRA